MGFRIEGSRLIFTSETNSSISRRDFLKTTVAAGLALPDFFGTLSITGQTMAFNDDDSLIGMDVSPYFLPRDFRDVRPVVNLTKLVPGEHQNAYLVADAKVDGVQDPVIGAYGVLTDKGGMVIPVGRDGLLDMAVFKQRMRYPRGDRRVLGYGVARGIVLVYEMGTNGEARAEATRPLSSGEWESTDFKYRYGQPQPDLSSFRFKRRRGYEVGHGLTAFNY